MLLDDVLLTVNTSLVSAANSDIGLVLDFGVERVEVLLEVVVEAAGSSVVLCDNSDRVTNLFRLCYFVLSVDHA